MKNILRPPIFLILAAVSIALCGFLFGNGTVDIHAHDTYLVIAYFHLFLCFSLLILLMAFIYWLTARVLFSRFLTWLHISVTLVCVVAVFLLSAWKGDTPFRYIELNTWGASPHTSRASHILWWLLMALLFAQLIWLVNIIAGAIKKLARRA